tara:strand:+ start:50 stop:625 length:576 start_codon:yes stop_codon:yes gene_type:complete
MIKQIHSFIIESDFPTEELMEKHKDWIIETYKKEIDKTIGLNVFTPNNNITIPLIYEFERYVQNHFFTTPTYNNLFSHSVHNTKDTVVYSRSKLFIYVQKGGYKEPTFHNHIHSSYLSSVTYLNIPKEGGEIGFLLGKDEVKIKPKRNKIYFFPSWLYHAPYPHKDNINRICLNIDFESNTRVSPLSGEWW